MNAIDPIRFDTHIVLIEGRDRRPWFIAADVCAVLEIAKHRDAVARLEDNETTAIILDTLGGPQKCVSAISESGLYTLIIKDPQSGGQRFRKIGTAVGRAGAEPAPRQRADAVPAD